MHAEEAQKHAEIAAKLLDGIKLDKSFGRGMDVKDGNTAAVAGAHAALALYHQREADREQPSGEVTQP
jgi:hypothetical protein